MTRKIGLQVRKIILRIKMQEYFEAIKKLEDLEKWNKQHKKKEKYY